MLSLKKYFQNFFFKTSQYSQAGQDLFAIELFGKNGSYIDIGAGVPIKDSNTYMLEVENNWKGFSVEILNQYQKLWLDSPERKNKIYWEDALSFDYKKAILENNLTNDIDFLSCDIDPQEDTFLVLKKVINDGIRPKFIAFETDYYQVSKDYANLAHSFLAPYDYQFAVKNVFSNLKKNKIFETWFVKKSVNFQTIEYNEWVKKI
tara:strand:+ start:872 stop:1486 length:615 start_codon:yes stop_codon:yes gene_type:complete